MSQLLKLSAFTFLLGIVALLSCQKELTCYDCPSDVHNACDNSNRPQINTRLTPVGTLSQATREIAIASVGNKVLFAGGGTSKVDIYDVATQRWSTAALSEARSGGLAAISAGNRIFFAGGYISDGTFSTRTVDIYDFTTNTWSASALSVAGSVIAAATVGNKVFFAGGEGVINGPGRETTVDIYDLTTKTWSTASLSEAKVGGHTAIAINNKIYFAGGASSYSNEWHPTSKVDIYDNSTNSWSTTLLSEGKAWHASIAVGNKIYWTGGLTGNFNFRDTSCVVEIRDINSGTMSITYLSKPAIFSNTRQAVVQDSKIIFYNSGSSNTFDIYDVANAKWFIGVLPVKLSRASIISVNNTIYLAGGELNGVLSDQVWKLEF